jgi:hypothetical protein
LSNIYPVYFTCADHFDELIVSVNALRTVCDGKIGDIYIYCDLEDFFSADQVDRLGKCIIKKTAAPMSWGGTNTVENELLGFSEISKEVEAHAYIMNIDADLIFVSSSILDVISRASSDIIGQPLTHIFKASWDQSVESPPYTFQQGACYFIRGSFVSDMLQAYGRHREEIISSVCSLCHVPVEAIPPDVTMRRTLEFTNGIVDYIDFFVGKDKSVVHMELTKDSTWGPFGKMMGVERFGAHNVVKSTIPKKIHYCWFGKKEKPLSVRKCIESWRRVMPDYEIKEWNEDNSPWQYSYMSRVYDSGNWSKVSDFVRFYALFTEGGFYFDTDVEVLKSMNSFLNDSCFFGYQFPRNPTGTGSDGEWRCLWRG